MTDDGPRCLRAAGTAPFAPLGIIRFRKHQRGHRMDTTKHDEDELARLTRKLADDKAELERMVG